MYIMKKETETMDMDYKGVYRHDPDPLANMTLLVNWLTVLRKVKVSNLKIDVLPYIKFDINTAEKEVVIKVTKGLDLNMVGVRTVIERDISRDLTKFTLQQFVESNEFIEVGVDQLWSGGRNPEEWLWDGWNKIAARGGPGPWGGSTWSATVSYANSDTWVPTEHWANRFDVKSIGFISHSHRALIHED